MQTVFEFCWLSKSLRAEITSLMSSFYDGFYKPEMANTNDLRSNYASDTLAISRLNVHLLCQTSVSPLVY